MQNSGKGGTTFGGEFATGAERVADAAAQLATWSALQGGCYGSFPINEKPPTPDYNRWPGGGHPGTWPANIAGDFRSHPAGLPATIAPDAREIYPPTLPPGCVAYMDGPYELTTGYGHAFPRAEQVEVIRRWDEAGAACYVSEAEPIPELVADGWRAVEITSTRVGQKRTFSKQKREWLTCNREPAWVPAVQQGLFG
jgi:hypothetical protein